MANPYVEIKLKGFKELGEKLQSLGPKVARNGLRSTAFAGAKVIREAAKRTHAFKDRTGTLRANIIAVQTRGIRDSDKQASYRVTVRSGKRVKYANTSFNRRLRRVGKTYAPEGKAFYGRFLEFGTSKMAARPFLRPAFFENTDNALDAMRERMEKAIADAAK